ncbi:hypothetical protein BJX63DRAFT_395393 [Aspergillus granulosus]|uniref:Zn(2)-C6 fungal-type domain-containing protein n=1 Tax=Aspergillus granulosus TaxID=176169 RepID=A0ABR4HC38_9EURO
MASSHPRPLATIAPHPTHIPPPKPPLVPRRTKQSSACTGCKARKTKCSDTQPCKKCVQTGSECIFPAGLDRRKKYAQRRAELELETVHRLLDLIIELFEAGDMVQLKTLITSVKENRARELALFGNQVASIQGTGSECQGLESSSVPGDDLLSDIECIIERPTLLSSSSASSVGSLNAVNTFTEGTNRDEGSHETGYIGEEYGMTWII